MKNSKILVVFYSKGGTTRKVAHLVAESLSSDIEEIHECNRYVGWAGYLRALVEGLAKSAPNIEPVVKDPSEYQLVIVGTPLWMMNLASPLRTYLIKKGEQIKNVAYFATYSGGGEGAVAEEIKELCHKTPVTHLMLKAEEVHKGAALGKIRSFALRLKSFVEPKREKVAS